MEKYIMFNRCVNDRDPRFGTNEYIVFKRGEILNRFTTSPQVATRYRYRYSLIPASPADYLREVIHQ